MLACIASGELSSGLTDFSASSASLPGLIPDIPTMLGIISFKNSSSLLFGTVASGSSSRKYETAFFGPANQSPHTDFEPSASWGIADCPASKGFATLSCSATKFAPGFI